MFFIRIIGFILLIFIGGCLIIYVFNGKKIFLQFAWKALKFAAIIVLMIFGTMVLERFAIIVW